MNKFKKILLGLMTLVFMTGCSPKKPTYETDQPYKAGLDTSKTEVEVEIDEKVEEQVEKEPHTEEEQAEVEKEESADTSNRNDTSEMFETETVRVVDGDTIKIMFRGREESVRFLLVDTPETVHPNKPEQPFGREASDHVKKMLEGKKVRLEQDVSERDKYGRLLMYIYDENGVSVQEELLRLGLARVAYIYPPNIKHVDKYKAIQEDAQKRGVGIWSIENYVQESGFNHEGETKVEPAKKSTTSTSSESSTESSSGDLKIKGNINSSGEKIYHMPGGMYYDRTNINGPGEQYFKSEADAQAAGFRKSQR